MADVLQPRWWSECEEPEPQPKEVTLKMTPAKLDEILRKAAARAGKEAKQKTAGYKKRLAELQTEIAEVRAEILQVLEARLAQLKQQH